MLNPIDEDTSFIIFEFFIIISLLIENFLKKFSSFNIDNLDIFFFIYLN
jgi:hypothetical protein